MPSSRKVSRCSKRDVLVFILVVLGLVSAALQLFLGKLIPDVDPTPIKEHILAGSDGALIQRHTESSGPNRASDRSNHGAVDPAEYGYHPSETAPEPRTDEERCAAFMAKVHRVNDCFRHDPGCDVHAPVYHYALHAGSGFGRPVEQSVLTCYLASALGRPCVVDYRPRDPYYTWRSFINVGTLDWDPQVVDAHLPNVTDAITKLPGGNPGHHLFDRDIPYEDVLPMMHTENWTTAERDWSGEINEAVRHKILLSPNYGLSWRHIERQIPIERIGGCPRERFYSVLQNSMYRPTSLSQYLHERRRDSVLNTTHYGGIHLRTKVHDIRKLKLSNEQYLEVLESCLQSHPQIKVWWLVSDDVEVAKYITANATTNIVTAYTEEFVAKNVHSKADGADKPGPATDLFGHNLMAQSVMDWMVLHESEVALITFGAFGGSGAKGHGKYRKEKCGQTRPKIFHTYST